MGNVYFWGVGGTQERFSNFGKNKFLSGEIAGKALSVRKNFTFKPNEVL